MISYLLFLAFCASFMMIILDYRFDWNTFFIIGFCHLISGFTYFATLHFMIFDTLLFVV